jgi:outer membrane receptor protein involved in Fe transport
VFRRGAILIACLTPFVLAAPALAIDVKVVQRDSGEAIVDAEVSILGRPGVARTDARGMFTWKPDPVPPFEVLVILPGGRYMKPVLVEKLPEQGPIVLEVAALLEESVTVAGSAPRIDTLPASGTTLLSGREIEVRQPATLTQLLENVAGVSPVSEGHSAVPAVRGLARGRTLILIDGARVTSERRVGPSAGFLDPFVLERVEVARGPGSVAYGSDAFGGVIYASTRRVEPGAPLGMRFVGTLGAGVPEARGGLELTKGLEKGGVLFQAHYRNFDDYRSPKGTVVNSSARDQGVLVRGDHAVGGGVLSVGWQSDFGRNVGRPRNNSSTVRFYYPTEDSHRFTASYETGQISGFDRVAFSGFLGSSALVTDQDRYATSKATRSIERGDVRSKDFQVRGFAERIVGPAKLEAGVDVSGRFGLHALDSVLTYDTAGSLATTTTNVSVDVAHRTDAGVYLMGQVAPVPRVTLAGGVRGDRVSMVNQGGYFGDRSVANSAASGFASFTAGAFRGFTVTGQVSRGFRDPMLSDRYYRGPTGRGFITGNPDLKSETSLQFDTAIRYAASRYRWAFYAYQYRITNLVERYQTATDFYFYRNRGRARLRGVELEMQADFGRGVTLELAAQRARGLALDDSATLDDISTDTISAQVRKLFGTRAFVQVRAAIYAADGRPGPSEVATPGYRMVDASTGYTINRNLELRLLARNLLDSSYYLSPDPRWVWAPGISAQVTALVKF